MTSIARFFVKQSFTKNVACFEACKKSQDFFDTLEKNALQLQCVLLVYVFMVFVMACSDFSLLPL